jgi:hypothetical protein
MAGIPAIFKKWLICSHFLKVSDKVTLYRQFFKFDKFYFKIFIVKFKKVGDKKSG